MIIQHAFNYAVWMRFRMNWKIQIGKWKILAFRDYFILWRAKWREGRASNSLLPLLFFFKIILSPTTAFLNKPYRLHFYNNPSKYQKRHSFTPIQKPKNLFMTWFNQFKLCPQSYTETKIINIKIQLSRHWENSIHLRFFHRKYLFPLFFVVQH